MAHCEMCKRKINNSRAHLCQICKDKISQEMQKRVRDKLFAVECQDGKDRPTQFVIQANNIAQAKTRVKKWYPDYKNVTINPWLYST